MTELSNTGTLLGTRFHNGVAYLYLYYNLWLDAITHTGDMPTLVRFHCSADVWV